MTRAEGDAMPLLPLRNYLRSSEGKVIIFCTYVRAQFNELEQLGLPCGFIHQRRI